MKACSNNKLLPDGRKECRDCGQITEANHWQPCGRQAKGLGDWLAAVLKWFGFKTCAGCGRRQRWLNRISKGR